MISKRLQMNHNSIFSVLILLMLRFVIFSSISVNSVYAINSHFILSRVLDFEFLETNKSSVISNISESCLFSTLKSTIDCIIYTYSTNRIVFESYNNVSVHVPQVYVQFKKPIRSAKYLSLSPAFTFFRRKATSPVSNVAWTFDPITIWLANCYTHVLLRNSIVLASDSVCNSGVNSNKRASFSNFQIKEIPSTKATNLSSLINPISNCLENNTHQILQQTKYGPFQHLVAIQSLYSSIATSNWYFHLFCFAHSSASTKTDQSFSKFTTTQQHYHYYHCGNHAVINSMTEFNFRTNQLHNFIDNSNAALWEDIPAFAKTISISEKVMSAHQPVNETTNKTQTVCHITYYASVLCIENTFAKYPYRGNPCRFFSMTFLVNLRSQKLPTFGNVSIL